MAWGTPRSVKEAMGVIAPTAEENKTSSVLSVAHSQT